MNKGLEILTGAFPSVRRQTRESGDRRGERTGACRVSGRWGEVRLCRMVKQRWCYWCCGGGDACQCVCVCNVSCNECESVARVYVVRGASECVDVDGEVVGQQAGKYLGRQGETKELPTAGWTDGCAHTILLCAVCCAAGELLGLLPPRTRNSDWPV
jgi:hypothetical protein